jgi:glycerol-3-phosphate acyltransferase PlsY
MDFGIKVLLAYLLGSVVGSLVIGRLKGGVDIREMGSGNAGATNAIRTQGAAFGIAVIIIDIAKGWLAAGWLPGLALPGIPADPTIGRDWLAVCCAVASVAGHVWPLWHDFRGGKGGATLAGVLLALAPVLLVIAVATWLGFALLFGYVGLATVAAAASVPVAAAAFARESLPLLTFGIATMLLVAWAHRGNFARIRAGKEPRAEKLWLLRPRKRSP